MRVFVTGASGWVGSVVVQELLRNGHGVTGLVRSEEAARKVEALGARVLHGDIIDRVVVQSGCADADGVIHCGFNHDFSKFAENCENDRKTIEGMGEILKGSNRPLVVTSGIGLLSSLGRVSTENDAVRSDVHNPRKATEEAVSRIRDRGVNASVLRLPPSTHGKGDNGFITMLIGIAREKKRSAYFSELANSWSSCHRLDAAVLYRLALEKAEARTYHAAAENGIPFKEIAETIGRGLNVPAEGLTKDAPMKHFDWFAHFAMMEAKTSSEQTRSQLGWKPNQIGLLEDIQKNYFT